MLGSGKPTCFGARRRGSSPAIPTDECGSEGWSSSGELIPHPYCGHEGSSPSLSAFGLWQFGTLLARHDVAETYLLAMQESRVRLPLGALWRLQAGKLETRVE